MNVLIGFEESQTVCKAFRELGINAFSCDLKPCSGGRPEWHLQMDIYEAINMPKWFADSSTVGNNEKNRALRSKTFPGIANAMANQWGKILLEIWDKLQFTAPGHATR